MAKLFSIGPLIAAAAIAAAIGSAALAQGRLQASQPDMSRADAREWPNSLDNCAFCHGDNGQSVNPRYPSLAGLGATYIEAQLRAFATGERRNPNMQPLARQLTGDEITAFASYYSRQPAKANPYTTGVKSVIESGRKLVQSGGCRACHGTSLEGNGELPRLAGQGTDYLAKQLDDFAAGRRSEPTGTMKMLASAQSPAERKAVSAYLASLDPARR